MSFTGFDLVSLLNRHHYRHLRTGARFGEPGSSLQTVGTTTVLTATYRTFGSVGSPLSPRLAGHEFPLPAALGTINRHRGVNEWTKEGEHDLEQGRQRARNAVGGSVRVRPGDPSRRHDLRLRPAEP